MKSSDRILGAFRHEQTDKVPLYWIGFSSAVASKLLGREAYVGGGVQQWREARALWQGEEAHQEFLERSFQDAVELALLCNGDLVRPNYWRYSSQPTKRINEYTFLYEYGPEREWRVLRYDPESEQCHIFDYQDGTSEWKREDLERLVAERERVVEGYEPKETDFEFEIRAKRLLGDEKAIRIGGVGIGIPTQNRWLLASALWPDLVARYLDTQVGQAFRNIRFLSGLGFKFLFGGGDLGTDKGPLYSPGAFRELVLPRLTRVSEACHQQGTYHVFNSDGNLWPIADDLFGRSGIDGYGEVDRRAGMDLGALRREYPDITLLGNMSSHTLELGTEQEVITETLDCLQEAERSGGIIVGPSNYITPHTPIGNVTAMLETIERHR